MGARGQRYFYLLYLLLMLFFEENPLIVRMPDCFAFVALDMSEAKPSRTCVSVLGHCGAPPCQGPE